MSIRRPPGHKKIVESKRLAYVTDGSRGSFGSSPSIVVPEPIVRSVVNNGRELAEVIG